MTRLLLAFAAALIASVLLSALAFAVIVVPHTRFPGPIAAQKSLIFLDAVPSVANRLLPEEWRSHMTVMLHCSHTYCFPEPVEVEATRYIRNATPAYLLLFYVPVVLMTGAGRNRS